MYLSYTSVVLLSIGIFSMAMLEVACANGISLFLLYPVLFANGIELAKTNCN